MRQDQGGVACWAEPGGSPEAGEVSEEEERKRRACRHLYSRLVSNLNLETNFEEVE